MINHENNFATNQTAGTSAGATTTPLNSIPTVDAPYYLALDATNINSHYEVILVTSDSATNVNHAATSYDHTTAEEVRMILPAQEIDTIYQGPRGHLINGKIVPSVASNNLTVAIKTMSGADPSPTSPVFVRIGDTTRMITAALSVTKNAGTNWFNSGATQFATKEIDYFVYLGYNSTDGVVIGFARIPSANEYGDFSTTSTDVKYAAISTITNAVSGDDYEVIGRFAATLSAGAGYTWSVPTYTNINLIQRPIYETRWLDEVITGTVAPKYAFKGNELKLMGLAFIVGDGTNPHIEITLTHGFTFASDTDVLVTATPSGATDAADPARWAGNDVNALYNCDIVSLSTTAFEINWQSVTAAAIAATRRVCATYLVMGKV